MIRSYIIIFIVLFLNSSILFSTEPQSLWMKQGEDVSTSSYQFSNDGKSIYIECLIRKAGKYSNIIQQWDIENKKIIKEIKCDNNYSQMFVSFDDKYLYCAFDNTKLIDQIELNTGEIKTISSLSGLDYNSPINTLSISEDGNKINVFHNSVNEIQIIDSKSLKKIDSIILNEKVFLVKFSNDGKYAATFNGDSTLSIRNLINKTEIYKLQIPFNKYYISNVFINSEYFIVNYAAIFHPDDIEVYSMKTGELVTKTQSGYDYPYSIMLKDNKTILTGMSSKMFINKFDIETNVKTVTKMNINFRKIVESINSNSLAVLENINDLSIYDIVSEEVILNINKLIDNLKQCTKIAISPTNNSIYVSGLKCTDSLLKGQIIEYDFETGDIKRTIPLASYGLTDMILSKDGNMIYAVDSMGKIFILSDINKLEFKTKIYDLKKNINSLALSDDNKKLIAAGNMTGYYYINLESDTIKYDYEDPYSIMDFDPYIKSIALNKNGDKLIVAGKKKTIFVFEYNSVTDKFHKVNDFKGDESIGYEKEGIIHVGFSNDDKLITSAASDGYIRFFDPENYIEISKFKINPDSMKYYPTSTVLTKDSKTLVVGDIYPGLSLIDVKSGDITWSQKFEDFKTYRINSVAISDDNIYSAFCANDGSLALYKIANKTSVKDININKLIKLSPNPAQDYIEFQLFDEDQTISYDIQIFDILGETVYSSILKNGCNRIIIDKFKPGIYLLRIDNQYVKFVKL